MENGRKQIMYDIGKQYSLELNYISKQTEYLNSFFLTFRFTVFYLLTVLVFITEGISEGNVIYIASAIINTEVWKLISLNY